MQHMVETTGLSQVSNHYPSTGRMVSDRCPLTLVESCRDDPETDPHV